VMREIRKRLRSRRLFVDLRDVGLVALPRQDFAKVAPTRAIGWANFRSRRDLVPDYLHTVGIACAGDTENVRNAAMATAIQPMAFAFFIMHLFTWIVLCGWQACTTGTRLRQRSQAGHREIP
jgi:hypothetical protein